MKKTHLIAAKVVLLMSFVISVFANEPAWGQESSPDTVASTPLSLDAVLVLTPEFCGASIKKGGIVMGVDAFDMEGLICPAAEAMARRVFHSVTTVDRAPEAGTPEADVLLEPKIVDVNATRGVLAAAQREIVLFLEWTASAHETQRIVWVQTVQGNAKNQAGNGFTHKKKLREGLAMAVDDVMEQSAAALRGAPELRSLVKHGT